MKNRRKLISMILIPVSKLGLGLLGQRSHALDRETRSDTFVRVSVPTGVSLEVAESLKEFGRTIEFLCQKSPMHWWNDISSFNFEVRSECKSTPMVGGEVSERDRFSIHLEAGTVRVTAKSDVGLLNAAWTIAHRFGYRQYFPGSIWEHYPVLKVKPARLDAPDSPSFLFRDIWHGFGTPMISQTKFRTWKAKNRMLSSFHLETKHAFDKVIKLFEREFRNDLSLWAEVDGVRTRDSERKPCLGNPRVRELFSRYAVQYFEENPDSQCVSFEPSDGGGWCECRKWCSPIGSRANQLVLLANQASRHLADAGFKKYIAFYAYHLHASPPTIDVADNVIVSVATAFNKTKMSTEGLIRGWANKGAKVGVRDYLSVHQWDSDLPCKSRMSDAKQIVGSIRRYYKCGARFYSAEAGDNWAPNGIGYWLVAQQLWDIESMPELDTVVKDFCDHMFGKASKILQFAIEGLVCSETDCQSIDWIERFLISLGKAWNIEKTPIVRQRISHFVFYTHYCRLRMRLNDVSGSELRDAQLMLLEHVWKMRTTGMVHTKAIVALMRKEGFEPADKQKMDVAYYSEFETYRTEDALRFIN